MTIKHFFPFLEWLPNYQKSWFKGDLSAGLTVGIMLIPQGMAYASIAGLPPVYGLYASIVPLLIYALLGTSRQLAIGPVAMVSLLTATAIGSFQDLSTEQYIQYALVLAFMVGAIQLFLGVFKLGFLVNFLSHPVVSGFTSAAALIIGLSQLKHLLGIDISRSHHVHEILGNAFTKFNEINWIAFAIGIVGIVIIVGTKKLKKSLPGQLFSVVFGILIVSIFSLGDGNNAVKIVKDIPNILPKFQMIPFDIVMLKGLVPMALTIAMVSFMESIAVAKAIQTKHRDYKVVPNKELIGLGMANVLGSFFQSYPTTGGFSRTAVNDQAGAKTGLAAVISALLVVITLLFLTPYFYNLPKTILASVIMVAVFGLVDYKEAIGLWKSNKLDFWMLAVTFMATSSLGIELGIAVGVVLSLAMVLFQTTYPHTAVLARVPNSHFYRNIKRFEGLVQNEKLLIYRFDAQLFFANINHFKDQLYDYESRKSEQLELVIIDGESINNIDSTAIHALDEIITDFKLRDIEVCFTGVKGPVRDKMMQSGFTDRVGEARFFMSIQEAVDCYDITCFDIEKEPNFTDFLSESKK